MSKKEIKELELGFLGAILHQFHERIEETNAMSLKEYDFETHEAKEIFKAFQTVHHMGLTEFPKQALLETNLEQRQIELLYQTKDQTDKNSFTYFLQKMCVNKQQKIRKLICDTYNTKIEHEEDYKKKANLSNEMIQKLNQVDMLFIGKNEETLSQIIPEIYTAQAIEHKPIPSGFQWIDTYTEGFWRGLPHILAAESGNGKSTMMRNIAMRLSLDKAHGGEGLKVLIISLEMTKEILAMQFIAMLDDKKLRDWYSFNIEEIDMDKRRNYAERLASVVPNLAIDAEMYTPEKLARKIRASKGIYDLILVDYFQALHIPEGQNEGQAYNRASKIITQATKETKDVAVVLLSQITAKDGEKAKTEKQHREAKLRYAKQLLNDCAFELIIYQDQMTEEDVDFDNEENMINLFIRKNRNGQQEIHTKLPYFHEKGIIGTWRGIDVRTTYDKQQEEINYQNMLMNEIDRLFEEWLVDKQLDAIEMQSEVCAINESETEVVFDEDFMDLFDFDEKDEEDENEE